MILSLLFLGEIIWHLGFALKHSSQKKKEERINKFGNLSVLLHEGYVGIHSYFSLSLMFENFWNKKLKKLSNT